MVGQLVAAGVARRTRRTRFSTEREVEDGVDPVRLRCEAEGNPAPDIVWRKLGQTSIFR